MNIFCCRQTSDPFSNQINLKHYSFLSYLMKLLCSSFIVSLGRLVQNYPSYFCSMLKSAGFCKQRPCVANGCLQEADGWGGGGVGGVCVHVEARQIKILGPVQTAAPAAALGSADSADSADCDANDKPAAPTPAFYILWCEV